MSARLIPDWPLAWRFSSVQAAALLAALSAIQAEVLPLVQPLIPATQWPLVSGALALAIIILRLHAQPALEPERQQLELDQLDAQDGFLVAEFDAQGQDVDGLVEGMAQALYAASGLPKDWAQVSPESQERWRSVATAALARNRPATASEGQA